MTATKEKKRSVKLTKETRHGGTELTLSAGVLKAVLKVVGNAINTRVINPLYANVLFDGMNCITASNGEMRITAELGANGPAMLVPHERLSRIVAAVPSDAEVVMSTDGTQCKIVNRRRSIAQGVNRSNLFAGTVVSITRTVAKGIHDGDKP